MKWIIIGLMGPTGHFCQELSWAATAEPLGAWDPVAQTLFCTELQQQGPATKQNFLEKPCEVSRQETEITSIVKSDFSC